MPQIVQQGAINTTALIVPDLYVQIVSPQTLLLNGVPTNILGVVGTASWGPVNQAAIVGDMASYAKKFGPVNARTFDMGTAVAVAVQQGAQNFRCVRVTDGTDTKASVNVLTSSITFSAVYTGVVGNGLAVQIAPGTAANTMKAIVTLPGHNAEVFDNIAGTGNAFWVNLANAINFGNGPVRGPSYLVTALAGTTTTAAVAATYALTGGTDGVATITTSVMIGLDTAPRTGMYALRGQGSSVAMLADLSDNTSWATQVAFGLSEGIYMILVGPQGDTITNAVTTKATAGIDSYSAKLMFGDWIYWLDTTNGLTRLVSPQGFAAGRLANLSPEQSSLNKQIYGVVSTQKAGAPNAPTNSAYAEADLAALIGAGIDVICNPQPGGAYFGVRGGHNTSSNAAINGDNYTRLTNYIAATLASGMGLYVGQVVNSTLFDNIKATLLAFLNGMLSQGMLGSTNGSTPFAVVCNATNNPNARTSLGYVQADVQVQYQAINEKFIVNLQGGQTVTVSPASNPT
jgi:uncharacterized membrane protein YdcZ (DUF606 family)